MSKYFSNFFHALIIASFLSLLSGCGYKADPVYVPNDNQQTSTKQ